MNQDDYYNYIYSGIKSNDNHQQRNTNNNNNRESNTLNNKQCSPNNIHLVKFDKEIEFGKALELLHNELYSFKLMDSDDDNDNE